MQAFKLEERSCLTCGKGFRVLPSSPHKFCGTMCANGGAVPTLEKNPYAIGSGQVKKTEVVKAPPNRFWESEEDEKRRIKAREDLKRRAAEAENLKPYQAPERVKKSMRPDAAESRWQEYVNRAKPFVKKLNYCRMEIARLAIEACDIHYGGGDHWKNFDGVYTLKRFAQEIGIHYKTLNRWTKILRDVKAKVPPEIYQEHDFMAGQRTLGRITRKTPAKRVTEIYKQELERGSDAFYLNQFVRRVRTCKYFICEKANLGKLDQDQLDELRDLTNKISLHLDDFLSQH